MSTGHQVVYQGIPMPVEQALKLKAKATKEQELLEKKIRLETEAAEETANKDKTPEAFPLDPESDPEKSFELKPDALNPDSVTSTEGAQEAISASDKDFISEMDQYRNKLLERLKTIDIKPHWNMSTKKIVDLCTANNLPLD